MFHCRHHQHWLGPDFHTHQHRKGGTGRVWRGRLTSDSHGMLHSLLSPGLKEGCWQWPQSYYPYDSPETSALFSSLMFCALPQENAMFYAYSVQGLGSPGWDGLVFYEWLGRCLCHIAAWMPLPPGRVGIFL